MKVALQILLLVKCQEQCTTFKDEFYFKEIEYETYGKVCPSIKDYLYEKPDYSIVTLGQMHHLMEEGWSGWYSDYFKRRK